MSEKLNKLAAKLLDLSKRNNLVHFKELKAASAELLHPLPEVVFDAFRRGREFSILTKRSAVFTKRSLARRSF